MNPRYLISISFIVTLSLYRAAFASNINLTNEEIKWIERHQVVRYAIDPHWQPMEYLDNKAPAGLTIAYLNAIANIIGIQLEFVMTSSWKDSIDQLSEGKIDLLPGVPDFDIPSSLLARSELSTPYFVTSTIAITTARNRIISDISDFSGEDIIAIRGGGAYDSWIKKKYPHLKVARFDSTDAALNAVSRGQATAAIGPEPILHPIVRQRYNKSLFVAGAIRDLPLALRIGIASKDPELRSIVQKALSAISAEDSDQIQEEWVEDADFGQPSLSALIKYYGMRMVAIIFIFSMTIVALYQVWRTRDAISEIAKQRAAFLSIMAHEIRNPLNHILASVEMALEQIDIKRMRYYVDIAARGGESLHLLLTNALDYSKLSNTRITIKKEATTLNEIFAPLLPPLGIDAERKGLTFHAHISDNIPAHLMLDKIKIRQIVTNIASNAIKFTKFGSVSLRADQESSLSSKWLVFRITDTGIGISDREISKITKPFYQAQSGNKENIGAGLGLTICAELIHAMHGELSIESSIGEGTTVAIRIPLELAPKHCAQNRELGVVNKYSRANALVVEDITMNREIIRSQLEHLGVAATTAKSGQEAIDAISRHKFDIILLDCNLPDISGYDVAQHIKNATDRESSRTPIIAISADVDAAHVKKCLNSGMSGIITKPINLQTLRETLSAWITTEPSSLDLHDIPEEQILSGLRDEAIEALRCARKKDAHGIEFHVHRIKGIALSFERCRYAKCVPINFNSSNDFKITCREMIRFIRALDSEAEK
ncbi:ATP-binding protein [Burkholderia orbicola]|uniref:hybrid sensor histidine kinase/response regulator n=1 Tax=Burkholderia orbicola TaxID=2978683 RepID=UPI002FDF656C